MKRKILVMRLFYMHTPNKNKMSVKTSEKPRKQKIIIQAKKWQENQKRKFYF